jgi:hypothetical protein
MKTYLICYVLPANRGVGVEPRDTVPTGKTITVGGRRVSRWWHLKLGEDGVYHRPDGPKQKFGLFTQWSGLLPSMWLDRAGNLRNGEGRVVFRSNLRETLLPS